MRGKKIAFIANGLYTIGFSSAIQQFLTQAGNRHIHAAIQPIIIDTAQRFQQRVAIHNLSGVCRQFPEQFKIGGGERYEIAIELDRTVKGIDG